MTDGFILFLPAEDATEYFCNNCRKFRLCFDPLVSVCGSCGSDNIKSGKVMSLNKAKLVEAWERGERAD
jgi:hypothetical protein